MMRELKENPEFYKAFPHLQPPMYKITNPELSKATDGKAVEYSEEYRNIGFFDQEELKPDSHDKGYFESLMHQHDRYMDLNPSEKEEMIRENELSFVQAYHSP